MPKYRINPDDPRPAYLQLYHQLRDDITGGFYPCGSRLPSKRTLAEDTGTSVITTEHALQLLADEGYTETRERSGCYVSYRPDDLFPVAGAVPSAPSVKPRGGGAETERFFSFASFARTMRRVISKYGESLLIKSHSQGAPELRAVLASYLGRSRGIVVSPDQIVIGSGAEYLYGLIVQMLGRGRIYGLEDPSYPQIRRVYEANGAACKLLKMGPDGIESRALRETDASVLHVTPFNSYPSGVTAGASKRREYIEWARSRGALLVEDDVDSEFTLSSKAEDTLFSLGPAREVIYLNTFSRTIAPSMRLGYMVLPSGLCSEYLDRISFYSCTVPVFEQYVLAEFIGSGEFERHINRVRRILRKKSREEKVQK